MSILEGVFKYIETSRLWLFQQFEKMDLIMHIMLTLFAFDESTFHKGYNYGYCCKHHNTTLFSVYFVLKFGLASFRSLPVVYMIMQSFLISSTTFPLSCYMFKYLHSSFGFLWKCFKWLDLFPYSIYWDFAYQHGLYSIFHQCDSQ